MLVQAYLAGDDDAFSIIAHDHYDALRAQARRMLGPWGQPEDAVQETFERALKGIRRFGLTGEYRLGAWLGRILSNVCSDQRARSSRDVRLAQAAGATVHHEADIAEAVSDPAIVETLREALQSLPATHRQALVLHELGGLPYAEVAEAENISVENARARVSRAKNSLQHRLAGIRSSAGVLAGLPVIRSLTRPTRGIDQSPGESLASGPVSGGRGGLSSLIERLASQMAASPLGQTAMSLVSSVPRGTVLVSMAATVATVSISTTVLNPSPQVYSSVAAHSALTADVTPLASSAPVAATSSAATNPSTSSSSQYGWVDSSAARTQAVTSLPSATCYSDNGIAPPGAGFDPGAPLGMADAVSVAEAAPVDLATTGLSVAFLSGAVISAFSGSSVSLSADLDVNACLGANGWLTAAVTVPGSSGSASLQGSLADVIGTTGDLSYIFRGSVTPAVGGAADTPLLAATQFVAQLVVVEPDNTAQLTVVFLSSQPNPVTLSAATSQSVSPSPSVSVTPEVASGSSDPESADLADSQALAGLSRMGGSLQNVGPADAPSLLAAGLGIPPIPSGVSSPNLQPPGLSGLSVPSALLVSH